MAGEVEHITGQSFTFWLGPILVTVENISLTVTDETEVKYSNGRPNGYVRGKVSAEGEMEFDAENLALVSAYAAKQGSWRELTGIDVRGIALGKGTGKTVEAFGCLLQVKDVLNANPNGNEADTTKVAFKVAGEEFVKLNGIPYLEAKLAA